MTMKTKAEKALEKTDKLQAQVDDLKRRVAELEFSSKSKTEVIGRQMKPSWDRS